MTGIRVIIRLYRRRIYSPSTPVHAYNMIINSAAINTIRRRVPGTSAVRAAGNSNLTEPNLWLIDGHSNNIMIFACKSPIIAHRRYGGVHGTGWFITFLREHISDGIGYCRSSCCEERRSVCTICVGRGAVNWTKVSSSRRKSPSERWDNFGL